MGMWSHIWVTSQEKERTQESGDIGIGLWTKDDENRAGFQLLWRVFFGFLCHIVCESIFMSVAEEDIIDPLVRPRSVE